MGFNETIKLLASDNSIIDPADFLQGITERITDAVRTISTSHSYIHEGIAYTMSNKMDIAGNKVGGISITGIPTGSYLHFQPAGIACVGGPVIVSLMEDYTFEGGSTLTPVNRKRSSTRASVITMKGSTDLTAVAGSAPLNLNMLVIPSSTQGSQKLGAAGSLYDEWIFPPGKNYLLVFSNTTGTQVTVGYDLFWYEEGAE